MTATRNAGLALAGAAAARAALAGVAVLTGRPAGAPWRRMNYAKRPVTLLGGPALAASATLSAVLGAPAGTRAATALVGTDYIALALHPRARMAQWETVNTVATREND